MTKPKLHMPRYFLAVGMNHQKLPIAVIDKGKAQLLTQIQQDVGPGPGPIELSWVPAPKSELLDFGLYEELDLAGLANKLYAARVRRALVISLVAHFVQVENARKSDIEAFVTSQILSS